LRGGQKDFVEAFVQIRSVGIVGYFDAQTELERSDHGSMFGQGDVAHYATTIQMRMQSCSIIESCTWIVGHLDPQILVVEYSIGFFIDPLAHAQNVWM